MIDAQQNIILNRAADFIFPLSKTTGDGTVVDISQTDYHFVAQGCFTYIPDLDPDVPTGRLVHFTPEHAATLSSPAAFDLIETSSDGLDSVVWTGTISAVGFVVS